MWSEIKAEKDPSSKYTVMTFYPLNEVALSKARNWLREEMDKAAPSQTWRNEMTKKQR